MGRVSRRRIDPWVEERMFELFWQLLATLTKPTDVNLFFKSLLSYTEQVMLAKRLAISLLLHRNYTYEEISSLLKVSTATVATVHKALLVGSPGYQMAITLVEKQAREEAFWDKLEELLLKFSPPAAYGSPKFISKSTSGKRLYRRRRKRELLG